MQVTVRYFAGAREAAGLEDESLEIEDGGDLRLLFSELVARHPALDDLAAGLRFALDEAFVPLTAPLEDGAVVALIPPVGGG